MNGSFDVSTVVFAVLAIFVVWKLRSVLGTRTGTERPPFDPFVRRKPTDAPTTAPPANDRDNVIALPGADGRPARPATVATDPEPWKGFAEPGSAAALGLDAIVKSDRSFAVKPFMDGARLAYETVILAFARGDRESLAPLLAKDVYDGFARAITDRESRGETVETTFVSIDRESIEEASLRGAVAQITIRFDAKLISLTRDRAGTVIDGATDKVSDMVDRWTFAREVTSRDPNWKLVATETGH